MAYTRFTAKSLRKVISVLDKEFTWDNREINLETCTYIAWNHENGAFVDFDRMGGGGVWFYYSKNNKKYHKVIKTYAELNDLVKLFKVMF